VVSYLDFLRALAHGSYLYTGESISLVGAYLLIAKLGARRVESAVVLKERSREYTFDRPRG
jgi:hypothetical protein